MHMHMHRLVTEDPTIQLAYNKLSYFSQLIIVQQKNYKLNPSSDLKSKSQKL